jgi:hypothetical protein
LDFLGSTDPYTASAVHFAGSTWLQRHAWLTGIGDFNKFIFSVWTKLSNAGDGLFAATAGASDFFQQGVTIVSGTEYFNMSIADSYFDTYPNTPGMETGSWQHVLWSTDISGADGTSGGIVRQIYVNESNIASTDDDDAGTDPTVSNLTDFYFADDGFGTRITGDIADFQMWIGTSLDLSIAANRELFIRDGAPVNPIIASQTLGTPTILFRGDATTFATNQGSGGDFTLHGSLTTVAGPSAAPYSATLPGAGLLSSQARLRQRGSVLLAGSAALVAQAAIVAPFVGQATLAGSGQMVTLEQATPRQVNGAAAVNGASVTSLSPGLPTGRVNGDIMLGVCFVNASKTFSVGGGWTIADTTADGNACVFWRLVDGSEAAPTISWSGAAAAAASGLIMFRGNSTTDAIGNIAKNNGTGTTLSLTAVTTTRNCSVCMTWLMADASNQTVGLPSTYVNIGPANSVNGSNRACYKQVQLNGTSPANISVAITSATWQAFQVEVRCPG